MVPAALQFFQSHTLPVVHKWPVGEPNGDERMTVLHYSVLRVS